ncbi:MAG: hypothetical protein ACR2Q4_09860 [Geminicoccaceae bacterium]
MSMMFDRDTQFTPRQPANLVLQQPVLDDEIFSDDLYSDRDSVLERDEFLETSLDDYDDLFAAVHDDYFEE